MKIILLIKPVLCGVALLWSVATYGQWDNNLPLGAMPMQFNSSFAGEAEALRLNTGFSYVHTNINSSINQTIGYNASVDKFIPAIKSGLGFSIGRSAYSFQSGYSPGGDFDDRETSVYAMAALAPKFSIKGKYTLSPSLDIAYRRRDRVLSYNPQYNTQVNLLQSRIGLLFNTEKYYVGYTVHLFHHYWYGEIKPLYLYSGFTSYLQAGYSFQRSRDSKFSFTPQLVLSLSENDFRNGRISLLPNLTFRYSHFMAGFNHTGIHIGYQNDKLRILVSSVPWGYGEVGPFSSGNLATRYIFKN